MTHIIWCISVNLRNISYRNIMQIQRIVTSLKKVFETRFMCKNCHNYDINTPRSPCQEMLSITVSRVAGSL